MIFEKLEIPEVILIKPKIFNDDRGSFFESYNKREFCENGITEEFVQDNQSVSRAGTIRGLHFQLNPMAQGKLVRVTYGKVMDVAVDIRKGSPTFGKHVSVILDSHDGYMMYVPPGFAHGFQCVSIRACFCYKCTELYSKEHEGSIHHNDKDIGICWKSKERLGKLLVSEKDMSAPLLKDIIDKINFEYTGV